MKKLLSSIAIIIAFIVIVFFILAVFFALVPIFQKDYATISSDVNFISLKYVINSLIFTVKEAFFSMVISVAIGLPLAYFVAHRNFPFRNLLISFSSVPFCVPTLLVALAYVQFFGMNGIINKVLIQVFHLENPPITFLYSFTGVVIAQGFYNFPLIMKTCSDTWSCLDKKQDMAAKMLGASPVKRFFTITIYQLSSAISSSAILGFIYCFFSFVIVLLFGAIGGTTIEVEIYQAVKNTLNFKFASILAIVETVSIFLLCSVSLLLEKKAKANKNLSAPIIRSSITKLSEKIILIILLGLVLFFFISPFIALFINAFGSFHRVFASNVFYISWFNTIKTALLTSCLAVITAIVVALLLRLNKKVKNNTEIRLFTLFPMTISPIVLGFGVIIFLQVMNIDGNPLMLSVLQASLAWPMAFKLISSALDKVNNEIDSVCLMYSNNWLEHIFYVYLPLAKNGIFTAFAFCFAISVGDASLPLILSLQNYSTLALYTFRLASSYQFSASASCGIVLMITGSVCFIISFLKTKWEKINYGK